MVNVNSVRQSNNMNRRGKMADGFGPELKARLFLGIACLWPLWILALFGASAPQDQGRSPDATKNRMSLRSALDRVDIMGYGPTHPRVGVVVTGSDREAIIGSVESVVRNTDLNRLFLICVVMDGHAEDEKLVKELKEIDSGAVPHWHGLRPDMHLPGLKHHEDDEDEHSKKIHILFNPTRQGVASSRLDGAEFLKLLEKKHEQAGFKSPQEDLILLFLQNGSKLMDRKWLGAVTSSLIVPPPLLNAAKDEDNIAMKLANAVALRSEDEGKRTSFDHKLKLLENFPSAKEVKLSKGKSYASPALNKDAVALRLDTFLNLPAQDRSLMGLWEANLDLAMNLWLCGDGIDIVEDAQVSRSPLEEAAEDHLDTDMAARFAAVWMEDDFRERFLPSYGNADGITKLDWQTKMTSARQSPDFPKGIQSKCRSFNWYATEVNNNLAQVFLEHRMKLKSDEHKLAVSSSERREKQEVKEQTNGKKPEIHLPASFPDSPEKHEEHHEPPQILHEEANSQNRKPSKPLRQTNLEIVQKAKPVDISFVDVSGGHKDHPHKGAKDENGNWGYIHDETALHKNPPGFSFAKGQEEPACSSRDNNWKMMTKRVKVETEYDKKQEASGAKRDKIFCLVYTIEKGHDKIPNIRETWGSKCDGFMVGSTKTDPSIGAVEIPHEGEEEYNNIWQKVRSMWSYIYDNYYENYDWFHIGGDDLFLIIENLRYYLESEEIRTAANGGIYLPNGNEKVQTPLLLGRRFAYQGDMTNIFDSGGSGYTMNKAALKTLVVEGFPNYFPHMHTFSEDTMVARIFKKMDILPYDTKDDDGGERYMPFMPGHHWGYRLPKDPEKDWYAKYSINIKEGPEHCSPDSLAFHYVKGDNMKRLFALAYNLCPEKYMVTS